MQEHELPKEEFKADPTRTRSPEWDFGVHWTNGDNDFPRWRVSWIVETGELYATPAVGDKVIVLGVVEKVGDYPYGDQPLGAWAEFNRRQPIERLLDGWAESARSLDWIRTRLAGEAAKVGPVHKATPDTVETVAIDQARCVICGGKIHKVPGGEGTTWVHESGAVAAGNPA